MKIIVAKRGKCYILIENRFCAKGMPYSDAQVKVVGKRRGRDIEGRGKSMPDLPWTSHALVRAILTGRNDGWEKSICISPCPTPNFIISSYSWAGQAISLEVAGQTLCPPPFSLPFPSPFSLPPLLLLCSCPVTEVVVTADWSVCVSESARVLCWQCKQCAHYVVANLPCQCHLLTL